MDDPPSLSIQPFQVTLQQLLPNRLTRERLQKVVNAVVQQRRQRRKQKQKRNYTSTTTTDDTFPMDKDIHEHEDAWRECSHREAQARVWHDAAPEVATLLRDLKRDERAVQEIIHDKVSALVQAFHAHALDATLARAGITFDPRIVPTAAAMAASSNRHDDRPIYTVENSDFDVRCLDAKERLYLLLHQYQWLPDFFRTHPQHFYENSFAFVQHMAAAAQNNNHRRNTETIEDEEESKTNHPNTNTNKNASSSTPPMRLRAQVLGLGVGGSLAVSGLAARMQTQLKMQKQQRQKQQHQQQEVVDVVVVGRDLRAMPGSRYQNASWRAYDTAQHLVDEQAFAVLTQHRQRILLQGQGRGGQSPQIITVPDRVQIVIGHAIETALESARRYGADLRIGPTFETKPTPTSPPLRVNENNDNNNNAEKEIKENKFEYDICLVFCGAHTSTAFPCLRQRMNVLAWPELQSDCSMWLQVEAGSKGNDAQAKTNNSSNAQSDPDHLPLCTRQGEVGAERWNFTISSVRTDPADLERILYNLDAQHVRHVQRIRLCRPTEPHDQQHQNSHEEEVEDDDPVTATYRLQRARVERVLHALHDQTIQNYHYTFSNAPSNAHNAAKQAAARDTIVMEGRYSVPLQIATQSSFWVHDDDDHVNERNSKKKDDEDLRRTFRSKIVVCGGDACVPPNPLAAYGATLACEAAFRAVQLAVAIGQLQTIRLYFTLSSDDHHDHDDDDGDKTTSPSPSRAQHDPFLQSSWCTALQELEILFLVHFEAKSRAENYFQFVQTLICNLYSIPMSPNI